jgi:hypothetical protein
METGSPRRMTVSWGQAEGISLGFSLIHYFAGLTRSQFKRSNDKSTLSNPP